MMLLPLLEITFKFEMMLLAASPSVATAEDGFRPIAWADLVAGP